MWLETSNEVYSVIFARHKKQLNLFSSFSDPSGNGYPFSTGHPEMITEWGFENSERPLLKIRQTKEHESNREWINEFFIFS